MLVNAAFEVLDAEAVATRSGPVGLCVLIPRDHVANRPPGAVWPGTRMLYAGYVDGRQIRAALLGRVAYRNARRALGTQARLPHRRTRAPTSWPRC